MKAAVLRGIGQPLSIEEIQIDLPGPREVLIRTAAAGVCHSDLHFLEGSYPCELPTVLGHEAAGVVERVGEEVTTVKAGDHVITCLSAFCGQCECCLTGHMSLCAGRLTRRRAGMKPRLSRADEPIKQFLNLSAFAEQMLVHEHACTAIRPDIPLDRAALIGCAVTTGIGAVVHTAQVRAGDTVAVIGCGGIGLAAIQGAVITGAGRIIAIDRVSSKLELAKSFGATDLVDASEGDIVEAVRQLLPDGVHYSFEAVGTKRTAEAAFAMLRSGGTATVIGLIPVGTKIELEGSELLEEKRIQGSSMGSNRFPVDMPRYADLYVQGRLKLDAMISARVRLEGVNGALAELKRGEVARSVIVFDQ
jgi:S-(hydroxymethyl)glutathione dehydrogenase / alcohol dehydrogenase